MSSRALSFCSIVFLASTGIFGQDFEVASVRPSTTDGFVNTRLPSLDVEPGRIINFTNISIRDLIMLS